MTSILQIVIVAIISSGFTVFVTYHINNRLDRNKRFMDVRREIYTEVHEILAGFFNTTTEVDHMQSRKALLPLYRKMQLWSSSEVVTEFNKFFDVFDVKNKRPQAEVGLQYTKLILAMRKDLVGGKLETTEIRRYGAID